MMLLQYALRRKTKLKETLARFYKVVSFLKLYLNLVRSMVSETGIIYIYYKPLQDKYLAGN